MSTQCTNPPKSADQNKAESEPLALPPMVDKPHMLAALNLVLAALAERRITRAVATTLLYGIKLAGRLFTEIIESGVAGVEQIRDLIRSLLAGKDPLAKSKHQTTWKPNGEVAARIIADACAPRGDEVSFTSLHSTDRLVEEMLAQINEKPRVPRTDPRFTRPLTPAASIK